MILFAANFPSRAAGRRLIRELQGIRAPARPARPAAGDGRPGGRPGEADRRRAERLGSGDGRPRCRLQRAPRAPAPRANLRDVGVNVDLAPVLDVARPGGDIAETERGFGSTAARVARTAVPFATALQDGRVAATGKHFPGFGSARANTDVAVQRVDLSKAVLRRVDEAPYRPYVAAGGEMVMLSTAIYPAFSPKPAAFARRLRRGSCASASASRVSRSPTRSTAPPSVPSAARSAPGWRPRGPGADLLLFTDFGAGARAESGLLRALKSGSLSRADFETSAGRVLRLRHRLSG